MDERHPHIQPRRIHFDWAQTPLHWCGGRPYLTHMVNILHLVFPAGERWFVKTVKEAMPLITDDRLRREAMGFMGQESVHAQAHEVVLLHMKAHGLDATPYVARLDWIFSTMLGPKKPPLWTAAGWLRFRLSLVAATEHYTAVIGAWALTAESLDQSAADPTMLDLLRWHSAEEVEHRSVAFDISQHVGSSRPQRVVAIMITWWVLVYIAVSGVRYLTAHDPLLTSRRGRIREYRKVVREGLLPHPRAILASVGHYMRRDYHPSREVSTETAIAYLRTSPAARAAGYEPY